MSNHDSALAIRPDPVALRRYLSMVVITTVVGLGLLEFPALDGIFSGDITALFDRPALVLGLGVLFYTLPLLFLSIVQAGWRPLSVQNFRHACMGYAAYVCTSLIPAVFLFNRLVAGIDVSANQIPAMLASLVVFGLLGIAVYIARTLGSFSFGSNKNWDTQTDLAKKDRANDEKAARKPEIYRPSKHYHKIPGILRWLFPRIIFIGAWFAVVLYWAFIEYYLSILGKKLPKSPGQLLAIGVVVQAALLLAATVTHNRYRTIQTRIFRGVLVAYVIGALVGAVPVFMMLSAGFSAPAGSLQYLVIQPSTFGLIAVGLYLALRWFSRTLSKWDVSLPHAPQSFENQLSGEGQLFRIIAISVAVMISVVYVMWLHAINLRNTSLLYIGMPYVVCIALAALTHTAFPHTWRDVLRRTWADSTICFLVTAFVIREGIVCVIIAAPIIIGACAVFLFGIHASLHYAATSMRAGITRRTQLGAVAAPLLIAVTAIEGTHGSVSFERANAVTASRVINASVEDLKSNLERPLDFQKGRNWLVSYFPMPYEFDAGPLRQGDVHTLRYRYNKWFVTNVHEGTMTAVLDEVSENRIRTRVLEDTSYLTGYMQLKGTEVTFTPHPGAKTRVDITVFFDRKLDPAWYFQPLQRYGVRKATEFLIDVALAREYAVEPVD